MIVGLVEGTQGQAVLFRTAIEAGFKAAGISTQHILSPATDTTLEGVDALLVFPNTADDCASSYQAEWASVGKRDGVRLFVPFEYGNPMGFEKGDPPFLAAIQPLLEHCDSIGLGVCRILTGPAMDAVLPGILRIEDGHTTVVGKGDTPISFVHSQDVGRLVAAHFWNAKEDLSILAGAVIAPTGDPTTYNGALAMVAKITNAPIDITHRPLKEVPLPDQFDFKYFLDWLMTAWETGRAHQTCSDNAESAVTDFEYQTVEEALRAALDQAQL